MLRAKLNFASSSSTTKTTQYVPPSSRCLQIIDNNTTDDSNGSFDISVVSGNTVQVATVDFILGEEQQSDNNNSKSSIRVRTGAASECSIQVPLSSSQQQRIVSSLYQPSSSMLLTASPSSNGCYDISYVKIDGNKMNEFKKQQQQKEDDSSDRRRQREDDSSSRVLSVASSFTVSSFNENNSSTLFSAAPSSGGSAFIGLDSISSSSVFITNGLTRTSSILDIETQKLASTFVPHDGLPSATCSLPWSNQEQSSTTSTSSSAILAVSSGSFITLWDTRQQSPISTNLSSSSSAASVLQHRSSLMPLSDSITCMSPFPSSNDSSSSFYLLTGSADRAVTLWDIRKWSKQHVAQNVLKFAPASVAVASSSSSTTNDSSTRPGCFVTASGSDSEVRNLFVPLPENSSNNSSATKNNTSNNPSGGKKNKNKDKDKDQQQQENVNGATGGSFRQRLQDATHCMTSWHGSWVGSSSSSSSSKQKFTVGMSRDFEVFVAKF